MRAALWFLALFGIAAAIALFAGNNQGTVTLFWPPYRVDVSLNLVLLLLALLFFTLHTASRALSALFAIPGQAKRWRLQHQERAMHMALLDSLSHLVGGRFIRARKAAELALSREAALSQGSDAPTHSARLRVLSHLLAAESAQALQDHAAREAHFQAALEHAGRRDAQETRDAVQMRGARWALEDRDAAAALHWIDELPQGAGRRTIALRLRLEAARLGRKTLLALETARLLAKHRAFSEQASLGILRSLALELIASAHDAAQLRTAWGQLDPKERDMPEVAVQAAQRLLSLSGEVEASREWLLPTWERMVKQREGLTDDQRLELVRVLENGFALAGGAPEAAWLTRIEMAQLANPRDAALQYLAGISCMRLQLWGKAQQLLTQSLSMLQDPGLQRSAWRALAELAERRDDPQAAIQAWRNAAKGDGAGIQGYHAAMSTLIDHIIKLTDHRDRDLLELTLSKALIDLLPIQRIVIARVMSEEGEKRWLEVARLDAKGGGKVVDPMRVDFSTLPRLDDASDRLKCLQRREIVEIAWAGEEGPRINMLPLFSDSRKDDEGVIEVHSDAQLTADELLTIEQLRRIYRNMYTLLEYSDRDALTGLLNRKSLDDAFYSAVLEELDGVTGEPTGAHPPKGVDKDRRHRVPANYWLGSAVIDDFAAINDQHGHLIAEEVLLLVARVMNNTFRTYDRIYRFGGEHFGVLMHCPDEALVLAAFERFRANVEKFNFPQVGRVTVSCGFTSVMADDSPSTTLEKTERAIDFAQRSGRNKVCSHLGLVRRGFFGDVPKVGAVDLF